MRFISDEVLTLGSSPVGLTRSKIDNTGGSAAERATIQVKGVPIRFSFVTASPTADACFDADVGDTVTIEGYDNLTQFKAVTATGASSNVYVSYET